LHDRHFRLWHPRARGTGRHRLSFSGRRFAIDSSNLGFNFAFQVFPTIIFFALLMKATIARKLTGIA